MTKVTVCNSYLSAGERQASSTLVGLPTALGEAHRLLFRFGAEKWEVPRVNINIGEFMLVSCYTKKSVTAIWVVIPSGLEGM